MLSLIFSVFLIYQNEKTIDINLSLKREELSQLSDMMNMLASQIENNASDDVDATSELILKSGYVNSLSKRNRAAVYDFLSKVRGGFDNGLVTMSAYARSCAHCAISELKGKVYVLEHYNKNSATVDSSRFVYGAGEVSGFTAIEQRDSLCLYKGNLYTIKRLSDGLCDEYVTLANGKKLNMRFDFEVSVFDDFDVCFFIAESDNEKYLIGKDNAGGIRYYKKIS